MIKKREQFISNLQKYSKLVEERERLLEQKEYEALTEKDEVLDAVIEELIKQLNEQSSYAKCKLTTAISRRYMRKIFEKYENHFVRLSRLFDHITNKEPIVVEEWKDAII